MYSLKNAPRFEHGKAAAHDVYPSLFIHKHALVCAPHPEVHSIQALELLAREECVNRGRDLGCEKERDRIGHRTVVWPWIQVADVEIYDEVCELYGRDRGEKGVHPCTGIDGGLLCGAWRAV